MNKRKGSRTMCCLLDILNNCINMRSIPIHWLKLLHNWWTIRGNNHMMVRKVLRFSDCVCKFRFSDSFNPVSACSQKWSAVVSNHYINTYTIQLCKVSCIYAHHNPSYGGANLCGLTISHLVVVEVTGFKSCNITISMYALLGFSQQDNEDTLGSLHF